MTTTSLEQKLKKLEEEISKNKDISIINLLEYIIEKALLDRVSDIHIDPTLDSLRIRFRIDGNLQEPYHFPKKVHEEVISRIKILCKLRTDEHQSAQDGRFRYESPGFDKYIDVRVSIVPTYHGENAVLRLLSNKTEYQSLGELGFDKDDQEKILKEISKNSGMILVTGPTGSGKTTTLYSLIKILNKKSSSVVTIEDPIEYSIDEIKQIQVNGKNGLTFANGLRSILRQDPDIIMVGEIRDKETAIIAINTSLTGHLLLSTMHTNNAIKTIPRLIDMDIPEYLISSTLSLVIGQRLVRKICTDCKEKVEMTEIDKEYFNTHKVVYDKNYTYKGKGCRNCNKTGYSGRVSIYEILVVDEKIREAIHSRVTSTELSEIARNNGMTSLLKNGLTKVISGTTTIEEILKATNE